MIATLQIPIGNAYIKQGDTIPKITITFSENIGLSTSTVKMQLYKGTQKVLDITNDSGVTIVSDTVFEIDAISKDNNNLPDGKLYGDLEITDTNGVRLTYFNVEYTILKQYTK